MINDLIVKRPLGWWNASAFFLLFGMIGCGNGGLSPVTGTVLYNGKPAAGVSVQFRLVDEKTDDGINYPIGVTDDAGKFELELADVGRGAMPGKYKVLILWPDDKEAREAAIDAKNLKRGKKSKKQQESAAAARRDPASFTDRLKYRYFKLDSPLLSAEVKPGKNELPPFEIKD